MSAVELGFDKTTGEISLKLNGEKMEGVAAVNIAASEIGSVCTVVFKADTVDCTALIDRLIIAEEHSSEHGAN